AHPSGNAEIGGPVNASHHAGSLAERRTTRADLADVLQAGGDALADLSRNAGALYLLVMLGAGCVLAGIEANVTSGIERDITPGTNVATLLDDIAPGADAHVLTGTELTGCVAGADLAVLLLQL